MEKYLENLESEKKFLENFFYSEKILEESEKFFEKTKNILLARW